MALTAARPIFTQAWVDGLRTVPESAMAAVVEVFTPGESIYDPDLDVWLRDPNSVVYTGKARVQPLRTVNHDDAPGNDTLVQNFLFSIPIANKAVDLKTDQQVWVLSSPLNPVLEGYVFTVWEVSDSSNPIEKTFICQMNQDVRRAI